MYMKIFKNAQFGNIGYGGGSSHQLGCFSQSTNDFAALELFPIPHPNWFTEKCP